jgi:hypothetical protein
MKRPLQGDHKPARIATLLGLTEGQVYTLAIGLVLASVTLGIGLPAALRQGNAGPTRSVALPPGTPQHIEPPAAPVEIPVSVPPLPVFPVAALPAFGTPLPSPAPPGDEVARTLVITAAGWATSDAGTPLADLGVPEGGLPVASRLGSDHRRSFIRLAGDTTLVRLGLVADTGANLLQSSAIIRACPITVEGWTSATAQSFDEAPAFDCAHAVALRRLDDGTFVLDLAAFPDRGGARGFALVPAPDAPPDFQVVFSREVLPPPAS